MKQNHYNSIQKSELYSILIVLKDFKEPLKIVTDLQYAERAVLHIETIEFIQGDIEITLLFIQVQEILGTIPYTYNTH